EKQDCSVGQEAAQISGPIDSTRPAVRIRKKGRLCLARLFPVSEGHAGTPNADLSADIRSSTLRVEQQHLYVVHRIPDWYRIAAYFRHVVYEVLEGDGRLRRP